MTNSLFLGVLCYDPAQRLRIDAAGRTKNETAVEWAATSIPVELSRKKRIRYLGIEDQTKVKSTQPRRPYINP